MQSDINSKSFRVSVYDSNYGGLSKMVLEIAFICLFLVNVVFFFNWEYEVYKRYQTWVKINITDHLWELEKIQREKQNPEWIRTLLVVLRINSLVFLFHILITIAIEAQWFSVVSMISNIANSIGTFPMQAVINNIRGEITPMQR